MSVTTELRLLVGRIDILSRKLPTDTIHFCNVVHNVRMVQTSQLFSVVQWIQSKREPLPLHSETAISGSPKYAMPNLSFDSLIFYPAYCFSLSPTYNTWARLTAADVHALKDREGYDSMLFLMPVLSRFINP